MENSVLGTILGLLPFILGLVGFGLYLFVDSIEKRAITELSELRSSIRVLQNESLRLRKLSRLFSPEDDEPFGALAENFNNTLFSLEHSIRKLYEEYSLLHQKGNKIKKIPHWKLWILPYRWFSLDQELRMLLQHVSRVQIEYRNSLEISEKIQNLEIELALECKKTIESLQEALYIYRDLSLQLKGKTFLEAGRQLEEWESTLKTQIPVSFLVVDKSYELNVERKNFITQIHRVLKPAAEEVYRLYTKLRGWQSDLVFISSSTVSLEKKQQQIGELMSALEKRTVSPIEWQESRIIFNEIEAELLDLNSKMDLLFAEELRRFSSLVKHLTAKQLELENHCLKIQTDYLDLIRIWSSVEIQQGAVWAHHTKRILDDATTNAKENWKSVVDLDEFRLKLQELDRLQKILFPRDPSLAIRESDLPLILADSRRLYDLHLRLRPEQEKIVSRLKEIQRLIDEVSEKISRAKIVMSKTLPIIASNPLLNKISGNVPIKLQENLERIACEIDLPEKGLVEEKVQKFIDWKSKSEIAFSKWLEALSKDIEERMKSLEEKFQSLGNFINLEGMAITETREILKQAEKGEKGSPLTRPGDEPLLVIAKSLWSKNDLWQRLVSAGRALEDIAGPVLERYQKAEKSRQSALRQLEIAKELIPEEPGWPPTTINLNNERRQVESLNSAWEALKTEHLQAIQLVGKLSDLSEQYQRLATQLQHAIEKARQEQDRIKDCERRLLESKRFWLEVVAKYPEYKSLKGDAEKLLLEIDQEYEAIKRRSVHGGLPYNQVLQNMRSLIRKINDAVIPVSGNQVVDINSDLQKRLY